MCPSESAQLAGLVQELHMLQLRGNGCVAASKLFAEATEPDSPVPCAFAVSIPSFLPYFLGCFMWLGVHQGCERILTLSSFVIICTSCGVFWQLRVLIFALTLCIHSYCVSYKDQHMYVRTYGGMITNDCTGNYVPLPEPIPVPIS